jgi:hypothetical protein
MNKRLTDNKLCREENQLFHIYKIIAHEENPEPKHAQFRVARSSLRLPRTNQMKIQTFPSFLLFLVNQGNSILKQLSLIKVLETHIIV